MKLLCVLVIVLSTCGPLLLLQTPIFAPRVVLGFGGLLFFASYIIFVQFNLPRVRISIVAIYILYCFAFSYGAYNAVINQSQVEKTIIARLFLDMDSLRNNNDNIKLRFLNREPFSKYVTNSVNNFPAYDLLIPRHINDKWIWEYTETSNYIFFPISLSLDDQKIDYQDVNFIKENSVYKLGKYKDTYVVYFKH